MPCGGSLGCLWCFRVEFGGGVCESGKLPSSHGGAMSKYFTTDSKQFNTFPIRERSTLNEQH